MNKTNLISFVITLLYILQKNLCQTKETNINEEIKRYTELRDQCLNKLNITSIKNQTLATLACMDRCILEKVGILSLEGEFNTDNIPPTMRKVATICNEETKALDYCQRAQTYNLCVFKAVGIKVLAEMCANETNIELDFETMPKSMMNLTDNNLACYNRCMLMKIEKLDKNNNINSNMLKMYVDDNEKVTASVTACEQENQQEDQCEQAVQRELCIMDRLT